MKKLVLITAAALLALSCFDEGGTTPGPTYPEATSPAKVLKNVEISFNQRNIKILVDVLSENFVFHFDPDDVGQNPPGSQYIIPETWSRAEFTGAVSNLFKKAHSISLSIPTASVGEPDPNATTYKAENINIKFLVMIDEINGYLAEAGYCNFEFERYDGKEGKKLWRLTKWWDNTNPRGDANPALEPVTFGKILAMYH